MVMVSLQELFDDSNSQSRNSLHFAIPGDARNENTSSRLPPTRPLPVEWSKGQPSSYLNACRQTHCNRFAALKKRYSNVLVNFNAT